jgi:uncharacterized cupin superfamily protein
VSVRKYNLFKGEVPLEDEQYRRAGYAQRAIAVDEEIGGDLIGAALWELEDGERVCPYHYHHGVEEWAVVISGEPTGRRSDGETKLRVGDVVCFPGNPDGAHTIHGPGRVLMLSREIWPAVVVYPDSDKIGARPGPMGTHVEDRGNFPRSSAVDYWHGEL